MGRDFSVMQTNVANDIQDTSNTMKALIKRYINRRYMQVLRAINFSYVNQDYTISVTAGTSEYVLPTDFKTELYAIDTTNGNNLTNISFQDLARDYEGDINTSGNIERYIIYRRDDDNKYIKFHYVPSTNVIVALPYIAKPTELSADTDQPKLGLEDLLEIGATADAWRYKRQFNKAQQLDIQFNQMFADFVWEQENNPNRPIQFQPVAQSRDNIY